jgi:nucleoside 2-deoxyribosyltransferase
MSLKIYCCYPMTGLSYDQVIEYYTDMDQILSNMGFKVLQPMTGKEKLESEVELKAHGYTGNPIITDHAIIERDRWMVLQSDILLVNLLDAKERVSIGSCMELAWGHDHGKHTIVLMQSDNIHQHAFVKESADILFESEKDAFDYLINYKNFNR